jgi:arginyl-tRNA synthetase
MKQEIEAVIVAACKNLFNIETQIEVTRPDEQFGDYATNIALQLAKQLGKNPREIAEALAGTLSEQENIAQVFVAGPGFLNVRLTDGALIQSSLAKSSQTLHDQKTLLEYSCPNAFKELHTGHLYQTIVGDALGRIFETAGATVYRANFGGDVGLHVAKCLFGIVDLLGGEDPEKLAEINKADQAAWISKAYVAGARVYEEDEDAKDQITRYNKMIYAFHVDDDHESSLAQIYWTCRAWSYSYFKSFYESIEVAPFDAYYPESQTTNPGMELVRANSEVFTESNGAVVYEGEKRGLHTRVFITSQGIPTYETKDLGVIVTETKDFAYDRRIIMTGNDQAEYMKVVFAALQDIDSGLAAKQKHITNGTVKFGDGKKMSSRLGNVSRAADVLTVVGEAVEKLNDDQILKKQITLGAIKYSFLKHRLGGDISFDIAESVSIEGNSGPYLQYAHARARSILRKTAVESGTVTDLKAGERSLVRKITEYNEVFERAALDLMPHYICTYLYELCQQFNRFYENNRVIGDARESLRVALVEQYANVLRDGLATLGIPTPEQM